MSDTKWYTEGIEFKSRLGTYQIVSEIEHDGEPFKVVEERFAITLQHEEIGEVARISKPEEVYGELRPAQVSWASWGSQDAVITETVAAGLLAAAKIARQVNTEAGLE